MAGCELEDRKICGGVSEEELLSVSSTYSRLLWKLSSLLSNGFRGSITGGKAALA